MLQSHFKRGVFTLVTFICGIHSYAEGEYTADFEVDGIYYRFNSHNDRTVSVCNKSLSYQAGFTDRFITGSVYSGMVNIPESVNHNGVAYTVTGIEAYTFYEGAAAKGLSVLLPKTITEIGEYGFSQDIVKIAYPSEISSLKISDHSTLSSMFEGLGGIEYPSDAIIEDGYIYSSDRSALLFVSTDVEGDLVIPSTVSRIEHHAIAYCDKITSVVTHNEISEIGEFAFRNCSSISNVVWPESVPKINTGVFRDCIGLETVELPNTVTEIGDCAFGTCENLKSINLPESIIDIKDWAFGETSLSEVIIPQNVTKISSCLFKRCYELKKVVLPENIIQIEDQAFDDCFGLEELWCEATIPPRCYDDWIFNGVDKSKCTLFVPEKSIDYYKIAYGWNWINVKALESNGIQEIQGGETNQTGAIYNIAGQRIADADTTNLPAGLYITKNRKIFKR